MTVTNPGNQSTTVGTAVNRTNSASGGTAPYTWSATGLPAGLSISASTGTITRYADHRRHVQRDGHRDRLLQPAEDRHGVVHLDGQPGRRRCAAATNGTDFTIRDNAHLESPITISGCSGNASATRKVAVAIVHTYIGDLKVDLVAPDGSVYVLHNRAGGSADNINTTYTVNLSSEATQRHLEAAGQRQRRLDTGADRHLDAHSLSTHTHPSHGHPVSARVAVVASACPPLTEGDPQ